jgi:hypothetical protein
MPCLHSSIHHLHLESPFDIVFVKLQPVNHCSISENPCPWEFLPFVIPHSVLSKLLLVMVHLKSQFHTIEAIGPWTLISSPFHVYSFVWSVTVDPWIQSAYLQIINNEPTTIFLKFLTCLSFPLLECAFWFREVVVSFARLWHWPLQFWIWLRCASSRDLSCIPDRLLV